MEGKRHKSHVGSYIHTGSSLAAWGLPADDDNTTLHRYHSIRIDNVHYCHREAVLADRRKRGAFLERNAVPEDTARTRLILLSRSVREDPTRLGRLVQFLKVPYMLREAAQADLARTIAVLPNLRYVDLPEGMFADEPPYATLRLEMQAGCPDMRRMTYLRGSEHSLAQLAYGRIWTRLETLELKKVDIDAAALRHALGALMRLRALKVAECPAIADDFFHDYEGVAPLPALAEFILSKTPATSWVGICAYLSHPEARKMLKVLTLAGTGVNTSGLYEILRLAPALEHISIIESIDAPFQSASSGQCPTPQLSSKPLRTLHYEITASAKAGAFAASAVQSHYDYLASSILGGGLPNLEQLYVRDPTFPDTLLGLPPPIQPPFAGDGGFRPRPGSAGTLSKPTSSLYTSGFVTPPARQRPLSLAPPRLAPNQLAQRRSLQNNSNPFLQSVPTNIPATLEVFTKGDDDLDWSSLQMAPGGYGSQRRESHLRTGSGSRPVSSYGLGADIMGGGGEWAGAGARRSVMIGDGAGGFLAVPEQDESPGRRRGAKLGWDSEDENLWPGSRPNSSAGSGNLKRMDAGR